MSILSCGGPYFDEIGIIASLAIFLVAKPFAYFAYIKAFRYRVSRDIPMTTRQAVRLAALRAAFGFVLIGGGTLALFLIGNFVAMFFSWAYLYLARITAWWTIGRHDAGIRGTRLVGWIIGGMAVNAAFDGAVVMGLMTGWVYPLLIVGVIGAFIGILSATGKRRSLQGAITEFR